MTEVSEVAAAYRTLQSRHEHASTWPQRSSEPFYEWANGQVLLDEHKTAEVLHEHTAPGGRGLDVVYDLQVTLRELGEARLSLALVPTRSMSGMEVRLILAS